MFSPEERERAVELYFTTPMTTAQVVRHLGYPTKQCLERWLAKDPRYAGHMAKPIIPLETRTKAIELVLGGMAALRPKNRNASQANKPAPRRSRNAGAVCDDAEALRRRVEELELENASTREVVEVIKKRPRRRSAVPVEQGEDAADRPSETGVFAQLDDMLARHRAEQDNARILAHFRIPALT